MLYWIWNLNKIYIITGAVITSDTDELGHTVWDGLMITKIFCKFDGQALNCNMDTFTQPAKLGAKVHPNNGNS